MAPYLFLYCLTDRSYQIRQMLPGGRLGDSTDGRTWNGKYTSLTAYQQSGKAFLLGYSKPSGFWFTTEFKANKEIRGDIDNGHWRKVHDIMKIMDVNGRMCLFSHSRSDACLSIDEMYPGGKHGKNISKNHGVEYHQMIPFIHGHDTFIFTFNTDTKRWFISRVNAQGVVSTTSSDNWDDVYNHTIIKVKGSPFLFGINGSGYWFLRAIDSQGRMGQETDRGNFGTYYQTLASCEPPNRSFLFGHNTSTHNWIFREVLAGGNMGDETDRGRLPSACDMADFFYK